MIRQYIIFPGLSWGKIERLRRTSLFLYVMGIREANIDWEKKQSIAFPLNTFLEQVTLLLLIGKWTPRVRRGGAMLVMYVVGTLCIFLSLGPCSLISLFGVYLVYCGL